MQLVINTRGSYLKKRDNCFLVKVKQDEEVKVFEVAVSKVDSILITTSAYITTDAIKFAVENNIDIVFLDFHGNPYGRVWHSKLGSTTLIRRRQLEYYDSQKGLDLAKKWNLKKIENQLALLRKLKKTRAEKKDDFEAAIAKLETACLKVEKLSGTVDECRQSLLGLEGNASKEYFRTLSMALPTKFQFETRSRNPAKDEFNCLLNYGYGVLYSMVEKACIISGLDPYIGFVHTDNYNKKSLVFDLIEMYRGYVDEIVMYLFGKRLVRESYFDEVPGGLSLNKEGKAILIESLNKSFDKPVKYKGRNVAVRNIIPLECHSIANNMVK